MKNEIATKEVIVSTKKKTLIPDFCKYEKKDLEKAEKLVDKYKKENPDIKISFELLKEKSESFFKENGDNKIENQFFYILVRSWLSGKWV